MTIFTNNLRRMFRKKSSWVYLLVIPIAVNVFIVALSSQEAKWVIGIHDADKSSVTEAFADTFGEDASIVDVADEDERSAGLKDSAYDLVISFPEGYGEEVLQGRAPAAAVMDRGDNNQTDSLKSRINAYLSGVNALGEAAGGDKAKFDEGLAGYGNAKFVAEYVNFDRGSTEEASRSVTTLGFLAFGLLLMMGSVASMLLDDRIRGIYDRVRITPLRGSSYFLQYFVSMTAIGLVQVAAVMAVIPFMTGVTYGTTLAQAGGVVLTTFCFVIFCVSLSVLIHRFAKTTVFAATLYSLISLPMLMLSGALWPRDIMPEVMQRIGEYMPGRWYLDAAEHVLRQDAFATFMTPLALLLGLSVLLLTLTFSIRTEKYR